MKPCENREENLIQMQSFANFLGNVCNICENVDDNLLKFCERSGAKEYQSDSSRQELSNEYLITKIGFDTAEIEPLKVSITDHTFDYIPSLL